MATTLSAPAGYSASDLVFNDSFSGTTLNNPWHNYITSKAASGYPWNSNGSGGSGMGAQYNAEYDMPSQVSVNNGLTLTAIKQSVTGVANGSTHTFPETSGVVSSYGNFEFTGGYLQISMQAPSGNGAWPALWLLPGSGANTSSDNYEIDIQEGGMTDGSSTTNDNMAWHLHTPSGTFGGVKSTNIDLTSGFHTYGIDWDPGTSITWYLDGQQIGQLTSAQAPIPSQPMEVIMSNQVGNSASSGWHTALDSSTPSSMPMQIGGVQLYQKAGSGDTVKGGNVTAGSGGSTTPPTNTAPTVKGVTAQPATGVETVGDKVNLTVAFSEAVTVNGQPTLTLNDGSTATYVSGSGTGNLVFSNTVASADKSVSALGVTSLNLPNGATIKDSGGLAADVSGAVATFAGLSVDTSSATTTPPGGGTTPPPVTNPTAPVLTVADNSLHVNAGKSIDLGISVSIPKAGDNVTVNIKGLPGYETITDKLDGKTFSGSNITLTAAQVNSGLTLTSNLKGKGSPTATLTVTATDNTGTPITSAAQSIVVKDPPLTTTSGSTSGEASPGGSTDGGAVADPTGGSGSGTVTNPTGGSGSSGSVSSGSGPANGQWPGHSGSSPHFDLSQWLDNHPDFANAAKRLSDRFASKSGTSAASGSSSDTTASAGDKAYALFNQMMAGDFGNASQFAQSGSSSAQTQTQTSGLLTRPLH